MNKIVEGPLASVKKLLLDCSKSDRQALFKELRAENQIHELEETFGAPAEVILEAIHRAPELTRRMLRGVIADAAFNQFVVPELRRTGWKNITPEGNYSFDYMLEDVAGPITIQVKLQRSEKGAPVVRSGAKYGFAGDVFMVEPQKTRGGKDKADNKTRPYRYGDFDVLAVSLQPSNGQWNRFIYTVGDWLITGKEQNEIATMQPVAMAPNDFWTEDFNVVAEWFRSRPQGKRIPIVTTKKQATKKQKEFF